MIFSAYTLHSWFKKSICPRRQNWTFHSSNSNNSSTSFIPLTPPFKGFVRFIRYVTLHSLRFALLHFIHFASFRQALPDSTRFAHSVRFASLHSFRFTSLISLTSPFQVSFRSIYEVSSLFPFDSFHWTPRLELYLIWKRQILYLITIKSSESKIYKFQ